MGVTCSCGGPGQEQEHPYSQMCGGTPTCDDCGKPAESFACRIRHVHLNTGDAKAARD